MRRTNESVEGVKVAVEAIEKKRLNGNNRAREWREMLRMWR